METTSDETLATLLARVRTCRVCEPSLPLGARPIVRAASTARLLIVGQAPGTKAHTTDIPWNDPSGQRLRGWLDLTPEQFYDESRIAIIPMGLCYPGRYEKGGDRPPRPECAPLWHAALRAHLPALRLTLLVGHYAQTYYLGKSCPASLSETVALWRQYLPQGLIPLPHPSWRTTAWQKSRPWFDDDLLPVLQKTVHALLSYSAEQ